MLLSPVRRGLRALFVAGPVVLLGVAPGASAQTPDASAPLPRCPAGEEAITTSAPLTVRRDSSYSVTFTRAGANVASVEVEFVANQPGAAPTSTVETFAFSQSHELKFVRVAPTAAQTFDLNISWIQAPDSPAACRGYDRRVGIPIVAAGVKPGVPGFGRLEGKYRVTRTDGLTPKWTLMPRCDLFACTTTLRSTGGLKGKLTFDPDAGPTGEYSISQRRYYSSSCRFTYEGDDTEITWREFETQTIKLRPVKVVDGIATELRGTERTTFDIPSDDENFCDKTPSTTRRVAVKLA